MQILVDPHPMLRTICRADFSVSFDQVCDMFRLLRDSGGVSLPAPQVGIDARLFVTSWREVFVNPEIVKHGEPVLVEEGCLSLPGRWFRVKRPEWVELRSGAIYCGLQAQVICHEIDHLNGTLISEIAV